MLSVASHIACLFARVIALPSGICCTGFCHYVWVLAACVRAYVRTYVCTVRECMRVSVLQLETVVDLHVLKPMNRSLNDEALVGFGAVVRIELSLEGNRVRILLDLVLLSLQC